MLNFQQTQRIIQSLGVPDNKSEHHMASSTRSKSFGCNICRKTHKCIKTYRYWCFYKVLFSYAYKMSLKDLSRRIKIDNDDILCE